MALVGEAGVRGDLGQWSVAAGELGCCPRQAQAPPVLPDREPVLGTEGAREVGRMNADRLGQLAEPDPVCRTSSQQRLGRAKPRGRPARRALDPGLPGGCGEQLEREPLCGKRRGGIRGTQLAGEPPREPGELAPA